MAGRNWVFALLGLVLGAVAGRLEAGLVADPVSVDFGDLVIAKSADAAAGAIRTFVEAEIAIENAGAEAVEVLSVRVSSPDALTMAFELRSHNCKRLMPGDSCKALVRYAPRAKGGHSAFLEVRASDGSELLVPLWGDALEVVWEGSFLDAPPAAFPAAPPGSMRLRNFGIVNDTSGDVLASATLEGSDAFSGELPPLGNILPPGGEVTARITCTYSAPPGLRTAILTWNVPHPMLPVVRAIRIELLAEVVSCLETVRSASVPREQAEALKKWREAPSFAVVPRPDKGPANLSRRLMVPLANREGARLGVCGVRFAPGDQAPSFGDWTTLSPRRDKTLLGIVPILTARPIVSTEPKRALPRRMKARVLTISREDAILWGPDAVTGMMTDVDRFSNTSFASHSRFLGPVAPSALSHSRAYAIGRDDGGLFVGALSVRRMIGGRVLDTPDLVGTAGWLPNFGLSEAQAVRAFAPVAVQGSDGSWREKFVAVARYASTAADDEQTLLLLLKPEGESLFLNNFKVEIEGVTSLPQGSEIVALAARRKKAASCDDRRPEIYVLLASRQGRISAYGCLRERERQWSWSRKREMTLDLDHSPIDEVGFQMFFLGEEAYSLPLCDEVKWRREHDHIGNFCTVFRNEIALYEATGGGYELLARKRMRDAEWIAVDRPAFGLKREKPALYVLEKRKAGGVVLSALDLCARKLPGTSGNTGKPILLTGDCTFVGRAKPGESGTRLTLEAHAFDPDGSALSYSWTAPGIEFDNPTSPTPSAFFPVGETIVYLVVRDGPAASAETRESDPRIVRVVVVSEPVLASCGDANGDAGLDISDAIWILQYLFGGGAEPVSLAAADTNGDGKLDISDPIYLLTYLFLGGPPPACPVGPQ